MRLRIATVLTATAFVVGTFFAVAGTAGAARSPQSASHTKGAAPHIITQGYCSYNDPVSDSLSSQNFETQFDAFDDMGAADCKIGRRAKTIHQIIAPGVYYNGSGPARDENVITWANAGGLPGAVKNSQTVAGADAAGTFTIPLTPFKVKKTVWFTVQANMDFYAGGQWGWDASSTAHGQPDQWQNPGGGFGICPTWCPLGTLDSVSVSFNYTIS